MQDQDGRPGPRPMTPTASARTGSATEEVIEEPRKADEMEARLWALSARHGSRRIARSQSATASTLPGQSAMAHGMLKLMLILLAFFILLHSRSEISAERVVPILDSLALRFASTMDAGGETAARSTARHLDPRIHVRRRLLGHLPISAAEVEIAGALFAFDLHETALFAPQSAEIVRDRLVLLHRLAQALGKHEAGQQSVLVVTTQWPNEAAPLTVARLSKLEATFADTPLELHRVGLGVAPLPDGIWRFAIRAGESHAG